MMTHWVNCSMIYTCVLTAVTQTLKHMIVKRLGISYSQFYNCRHHVSMEVSDELVETERQAFAMCDSDKMIGLTWQEVENCEVGFMK